MQAYIPVLDKPFIYVQTGPDGSFTFNKTTELPEGTYTLQACSKESGWSEAKQIEVPKEKSVELILKDGQMVPKGSDE